MLQQKPEVDYISSKLRASPIVLDAIDFGATSRPRLWWTRLDWSKHTTNPLQGGDLRWGKHQGFPRLFYEGPRDDFEQYQTWGYSFSSQVRGGQARMPCLTTPAPDEKGRPAPKRAKQRMSDEVRNRWLQAGRQYAPWHYEAAALMEDPDGEWVIPPIWVKEQLHHMPVNYTQVGDIPLRARHKMLGNSWHLGVVKFLLLFILQWQTAEAIPVPPRTSSMKFMIGYINFTRPMLGPGTWSNQRFLMEPTDDMTSHWTVSQQCLHPQLQDPVLEPGLRNTVEAINQIFGDIPRLRAEVVAEIRNIISDFEDITRHRGGRVSLHTSGRSITIRRIRTSPKCRCFFICHRNVDTRVCRTCRWTSPTASTFWGHNIPEWAGNHVWMDVTLHPLTLTLSSRSTRSISPPGSDPSKWTNIGKLCWMRFWPIERKGNFRAHTEHR